MLSLAGLGACKSFPKVHAAAILGPSRAVSQIGSSFCLTHRAKMWLPGRQVPNAQSHWQPMLDCMIVALQWKEKRERDIAHAVCSSSVH